MHPSPPTHTGSFLNYTASMSASFNASSVRSSHKKPPHTLPTSAERILDAPSLVDDYCKSVCVCISVPYFGSLGNRVLRLM